jgi:flagellin
MSLGVLNNLSAMSAAHNLSNTQSSLAKTLEQLSSGSKINSGADDAAGLSLVNGLQANATALAQSQTNAQEGVGLLQVADGALSQVTNLLNRAVTLATEVSNGTLNGSQQSAANQEYQSILSEINNIGSTTTYNQKQVFGSQTNIYTGDSSTQGASINQLNIRSLSSSNVGDTNGTMSYSNGQSNVFIDLSNGAATGNALATDTLNGTGTSSIDVSYLGKAADGSTSVQTATISAGTGTKYANTAEGLISAINDSGLGLNASFTTAATAGDTGATAQTDTGIMISGPVGSGTNPTTASYQGKLALTGALKTDHLTGSITLQVGSGAATTINMADVTGGSQSDVTSTLTGLAAYINEGSSGTATDPFGVHATVNTDGTMTLASTAPAVATAPYSALSVSSNLTDTTDTAVTNTTLGYTATAGYSVGLNNTQAANFVEDSDSGQTAKSSFAQDASSTGGIATISYNDGAGVSLSGTDLSSSTNAQLALTDLNKAIANVAAEDGYIGAQINTLNAVSSVMSTQQQNVVAAQNAVQATDYATAASNMSKFQILSQTGISALAQANSAQQAVLKLLQ